MMWWRCRCIPLKNWFGIQIWFLKSTTQAGGNWSFKKKKNMNMMKIMNSNWEERVFKKNVGNDEKCRKKDRSVRSQRWLFLGAAQAESAVPDHPRDPDEFVKQIQLENSKTRFLVFGFSSHVAFLGRLMQLTLRIICCETSISSAWSQRMRSETIFKIRFQGGSFSENTTKWPNAQFIL